jgi:hypothetical protein
MYLEPADDVNPWVPDGYAYNELYCQFFGSGPYSDLHFQDGVPMSKAEVEAATAAWDVEYRHHVDDVSSAAARGREVRPTGIEFTEGGTLHRVGGPARITANGTQSWFEHGHHQRLDGPAMWSVSGLRGWVVDRREYPNVVGQTVLRSHETTGVSLRQLWDLVATLDDTIVKDPERLSRALRREVTDAGGA